ncbi:hypothetical protein VaNZ11_013226 [Volvox africanus]|uniref:START domain-containing protein n=1 Tax=Volvox africanus TaxID=51714 RepID=A0ABQ5SGT8_9CHLO|nr:hypothetical protein VaNZ11_013226 [Volvox africanus]
MYASRIDLETQTYAFLSARKFDASPLQICCLVREWDLGKLAGTLMDVRHLESSGCEDVVEYVCKLPFPFEPRWIRCKLRYGVVRCTGALIILGVSELGAAVPPGMTRGTIYYSYYHIFPGDTAGTAVLYRVMNVDMHMPLPDFVVRKTLASHYRDEMARMESTLAAWASSPLQERFETKACYRVMEQAMATSAAALALPTGQLAEDEEGCSDDVDAFL